PAVEDIVPREDCAVEREAVEAAPRSRVDEDLPAARERVGKRGSEGLAAARDLLPERGEAPPALGEPLGNGEAPVLSCLHARARVRGGLLGLLQRVSVQDALARETSDLIQGRSEVGLRPRRLPRDPVELLEILGHAPLLHVDRRQQDVEHAIARPARDGRGGSRQRERQQESHRQAGEHRARSHPRHYTEVAGAPSRPEFLSGVEGARETRPGFPLGNSVVAVISGQDRDGTPLEDRPVECLLYFGRDLALRQPVDLRDLGDDQIAGALVHLLLAEGERLLFLHPRQVLEDVRDVREAAGAHLVEVLLVPALQVAARRENRVLENAEDRAHVLAPRERAEADAVRVPDRHHHARVVPDEAKLIAGRGRAFEEGLLDRFHDPDAVVRVAKPVADLESHGKILLGKGTRRLLPPPPCRTIPAATRSSPRFPSPYPGSPTPRARKSPTR